MGWNFRKQLSWGGVKLNFGKKGFNSVSLGGRGLTVNLNGKGAKTTVGLPGTGISYSTKRKKALDFSGDNLDSLVENMPIHLNNNGTIWGAFFAGLFLFFPLLGMFIFLAHGNRDSSMIGAIVLLFMIAAIIFLFIKSFCDCSQKGELQTEAKDEIRELLNNFWQKITQAEIVECVNKLYGTEFTEYNLRNGEIYSDPCYYAVTLFCGSQTIKYNNRFVRNKNVSYMLPIGTVHQILGMPFDRIQIRIQNILENS